MNELCIITDKTSHNIEYKKSDTEEYKVSSTLYSSTFLWCYKSVISEEEWVKWGKWETSGCWLFNFLMIRMVST